MPVFPAEPPGINYGYLSRCIGMACPQPYSPGSTPISVRTRVPVAPETRCLFRPTSGRYAWAGINRPAAPSGAGVSGGTAGDQPRPPIPPRRCGLSWVVFAGIHPDTAWDAGAGCAGNALLIPAYARPVCVGRNKPAGRMERLAGVSGKSLHRLFTIHIAQMIGLGQAPILRIPASTDISLK